MRRASPPAGGEAGETEKWQWVRLGVQQHGGGGIRIQLERAGIGLQRQVVNPEATQTVPGDRSPLIEHPGEQRLLRRMLDLRAGGLGARRIARAINMGGANPRTGRPWTPSTVQKLLATVDRRDRLAA